MEASVNRAIETRPAPHLERSLLENLRGWSTGAFLVLSEANPRFWDVGTGKEMARSEGHRIGALRVEACFVILLFSCLAEKLWLWQFGHSLLPVSAHIEE